MAENQDGQEKTEKATGKKLSESREKGQVAKSVDVTTASILMIGGTSLYYTGSSILSGYQVFSKKIFANLATTNITEITFPWIFNDVLTFIAMSVLPICSLIVVVALTAEISQVGFHFASKKFTEGLSFNKIFNPLPGLKRIFFSKHTMFELAKNFAKLIVLGSIVWSVVMPKQAMIIGLLERPFTDIGAVMGDIAFELLVKMGSAYTVIAVADYVYQKWKFQDDMKMTKTEVKEEAKQSEGDPKVKGKIRGLMMSRMRQMMMKNVQTADVVITNPTHYAVALSYKQGEMSAPKVVAKGVDFLALKIREIAAEHNVPIVEEPPLARALYKYVDYEQEIPENLFKAVAQVLAYIYSLKQKKKY